MVKQYFGHYFTTIETAVKMTGNPANIRILRVILKVVTFFGLVPFTWSMKEERLKKCSWWKLAFWIVIAPVAHFAQLMVGFTLWSKIVQNGGPTVWSNPQSLASLALTAFLINSMVLSLLFDMASLSCYDEILYFYNSLLSFRASLARDSSLPLKQDFTVLKYFLAMIIPRCILLVFSAFLHSEQPPHLPAVLPPSWRSHWLLLGFAPLHSLSNWAMYAMIIFKASVFSLHIETMDQDVRHVLSLQQKGEVPNVFKKYAIWRLLNRNFELAFGRPTFGTYIGNLSMLIIISTYGLIRTFGKVPMKLYTTFISPFVGVNLLAIAFMKAGARVHDNSARIRRIAPRYLWNSRVGTPSCQPSNSCFENPMQGRKFAMLRVKGLPDVSIWVGNYFPIVRVTYAAFIGYCGINAMSILINF